MDDKILLNNKFLKIYFIFAIISSIIIFIAYANLVGIITIIKSHLIRDIVGIAEYGMYGISAMLFFGFLKYKSKKILLIVPAIYLITLIASLGYISVSAINDVYTDNEIKYDQNGFTIYETPDYITNTAYINMISSSIILLFSLYMLSTIGKKDYFQSST